ncbi:MAG: zinc-ribbon domain containing protein [Vulcanimicrobiota bacterium]
MPYTDLSLTCNDCSSPFTFSAGEQEFHAQKGFTNRPGRCPACRSARKNSGDRSSSSRTLDHRSERNLYPTTCSGCGQKTEVPFNPSGDRPVYCRDCFAARNSGRLSRR